MSSRKEVELNVKGNVYRYYNGDRLKQEIYLNSRDQVHRENKPAFIEYYKNGSIKYEGYYLNGCVCRDTDELPSIIQYDNKGLITSESYFTNGFLNRENGPQKIEYKDGHVISKEYVVNGKRLTKFYESLRECTTNQSINKQD